MADVQRNWGMAAGFHEYGALEIQLQLAEGVPGSGSEEFWTSLLQELKALLRGKPALLGGQEGGMGRWEPH